MAADVTSTLQNYRTQLNQVEAALSADPENDELIRLKQDLQEVIELTVELLDGSGAEISAGGDSLSGAGGQSTFATAIGGHRRDDGPSTSSGGLAAPLNEPVLQWEVGDKCMALSSKDGRHYSAQIDEIADGQVAVTFLDFDATDACLLSQLRKPKENKHADQKRKNLYQLEREKRKLKAQKRRERTQKMEEEREKEKSKWQEFAKKGAAKSMKGFKKVQIVPESRTVQGSGSGKKPSRLSHQGRYNMKPPNSFV